MPEQPSVVVDTHVHILRLGQTLIDDRHSAPKRTAAVPELLTLMDGSGVTHAVVTAPSFYGPNNEILLAALDEGGGRLVGTVQVDPGTNAQDLRDMSRRGVRGLRFNWFARRALPDPASVEYRNLFTLAADLGLHVEVFIEPEHLESFADAVLDAGARLVVDHFGLADRGKDVAVTMLDLLADERVWVKLSAPYRLRRGREGASDLARAFIEVAGDRVLWGSDWPWVGHEAEVSSYAATRALLNEWVPDPLHRDRILDTNPRRLFQLHESADHLNQAAPSAGSA